MHPFFTRPKHLLAYIGSWLGLALLASFAVSYPDGSFALAARVIVPSAFLFSFVSLSSWYLCRTYPIRDTDPVILAVSILSSSILIGSALGVFIVGSIVFFGGGGTPAPGESIWPFRGAPLLVFTTGVVLYLLSVMFHYLLIAYESSREAERRSLEAEIHARSSELKALRAQIDPHFLFNALNSIAALITAEPARARTMTVQLAEFFRSSVAAGRQHLIPLSEELTLIRTYLDIEMVRYGQRLRVAISNGKETGRLNVPPLILQPLVENAIKHGIAHLVDGGTISVEARTRGDVLAISVTNPIDPDGGTKDGRGTSFGLQAVRDRLKATAPGKGFLDVERGNGTFKAVITLPAGLR